MAVELAEIEGEVADMPQAAKIPNRKRLFISQGFAN